MNNPTKLILVGADKGGVGKTTISKVVFDHYKARERPVFCFDTETPTGNLARFIPQARVIDIETVAGQVLLFDNVMGTSDAVVVVDFRAGLFSRVLEILERIKFIAEAQKGAVELILAHVVSASQASVSELESIERYMDKVKVLRFQNSINDSHFIAIGKADSRNTIVVPKLDELAFEEVDKAGVTFAEFVGNRDADGNKANHSFVLRGYVQHWLSEVSRQMEAIEALR